MESIRERIGVIDGLRGVAILLVVWYHLWQITWQPAIVPGLHVSLQPFAETGFLGVPLFFFISGFVLMLPHARAHLAGEPTPSLRTFALGRAFKIVPSYLLCIAVMLAIGYQTYPNPFEAMRDVGFHLLFVHNWFAATRGSIDGVMWSLATEVQFYLVFPLIAGAFVRRPLLVAPAMVAIAIGWRMCSVASGEWFLDQELQQLPAYLDVFAAGMLGGYLGAAIDRRPALAARRDAFTALALAGAVVAFVVVRLYFDARYTHDWPHPQDVALRPLLALALLAIGVGSLFSARAFQRLLANRALLFLAAISYNLYLWHQPIARGLLRVHLPPFAGTDPHADPMWQSAFWLVAGAAVLALAAILTYALERPLQRRGRRLEGKALGASTQQPLTAFARS